ncbi:MAG: hypothetical protein FD174_423 [Geobacteraceae bacterium]|nr:MAG: hypothetical protein FD174_423 [Geobacteraceae bacterium]
MKRGFWVWLLVVTLVSAMTGCGGGGGGGGGGTVSGVAAAGAPLVGTVKIKDAASPAKELTATIAADGTFSFDVGGLTPPFILKATGTVGTANYTLHSFATGAGTTNINPLANLAVAMASGGLDPATVYATPSAGILKAIADKLPASVTDIQTKLQPLLALYDAAKANPLTDTFTANHTGLDEVLDMVKVEVTGGTVTVRNKATDDVIVTGPPNAPDKWTPDPTKIPIPPIRAVISPIYAKVKINQTMSFTADVKRSANKKVILSVVETGGGTITDAGVYTAPATEGVYHVKVVSDANPSLPAEATVEVVTGQSVNVNIDPPSANVPTNGSKTFTATVTGTSNSQVTWSVVETNGGSITSAGVYTAPATAGTYHVKAASAADTSKSATATVIINKSDNNSNSLIGTWYGPKEFKFTINQLVESNQLDIDYELVNQYSGTLYYPVFSNNGKMVADGHNIGSLWINATPDNSKVKIYFEDDGQYVTIAKIDLTRSTSNPDILVGTMNISSTNSFYSVNILDPSYRATFTRR